jgi:hypothetical protein
MQDSLKGLDLLVMSTLHPANLNMKKPSSLQIKNHLAHAKKYQLEIIAMLKIQFYSTCKERKLELIVQRCQASVIHFTDALFSYSSFPVAPDVQSLYQSLTELFEELLNFIEIHFCNYFNQDTKIPENYRMTSRAEYKTMMASFKRNARRQNINKNLYQIIVDTYEEFYTVTAPKGITFRRNIYLTKLLSCLVEKSSDRSVENIDTEIINLLQYFNFNHFRFWNFITAGISDELSNLDNAALKIDKLHWFTKSFNQFQMKPQYSLFPNICSVKEFCIQWIDEELTFMKTQCEPVVLASQSHARITEQIETNLSVPQLAFIIKLLIDEGIIKNSSYRQLSKIAAAHFKTPKATHLSVEKLRIKTFSIEKQTVDKVKDIVIQLLNNINKIKIHVSMILLGRVLQEMTTALLEYV